VLLDVSLHPAYVRFLDHTVINTTDASAVIWEEGTHPRCTLTSIRLTERRRRLVFVVVPTYVGRRGRVDKWIGIVGMVSARPMLAP
jgi:hypothetical protein